MVDRPKHTLPIFAFRLDPNGVAKLHEFSARRAALNGFNGPLFSNATVAARPVLVADGAGANHAASPHIAGFANVGDQLAKVKSHFGSGFAHANFAAVPGALQRHVQATAPPGTFSVENQLVGCNGYRAKRRGGLGLKKTKSFGQLGGNQVAQRHVVGQHHQPDSVDGMVWRCAHPHVCGDHGNFGFKVNAKGLAGHDHIVTRADKVVAAALVHQRVGIETFGHV